ncbi:MAG: Fe(3+) ABC transporter substrate-binding protein [Gammaproteobacteria bacterium]|nr:Fe(3+) ABC transporter substrate-binding protein [Gammaproteobacteria bacterium]
MRGLFLLPLSLSLMLATAVSAAAAPAGEVNVYSSRKEDLIRPLLERFTAQTGVRVNLVTGKDDALIQRLVSEGANSPADLLITADAGRLHRAKAAGVLQPVDSATLDAAIPASYRDPQNHWFGLSLRARPIWYVKDRVDPKALSGYADLADPRWKKRVCVRSSDNIYNQSMVAALIAHEGEEGAAAWVDGLVKNFARKPAGGDRDQIKAAAAGQCDLAIANTYYVGAMLTGADPVDRAAAEKLAVFWPDQQGRGVHVNVSGVGLTAAAKHKAEAVRLMEFLVSDEAQRWYAEGNFEYPVKPGVPWNATLESFGRFKADGLPMGKLGELNGAAVRLMDRAGWK